MNKLEPPLRNALLWAIPIVVLALVLLAEFDWGRAVRRDPPAETPQLPAPVSVGLLPDYAIPGGSDALAATSEHTLFNPTRRPAPPAVVAATNGAPSQMHRGQFILTGTAVYGDKAVAYLKETAGGKPRTVTKGETINGMLVAQVDSKGVRFTLGDESEDLALKVVAGPKVTVQPRTSIPGLPAGAPVPGALPRAPGLQPNGIPGQPQTLGERRRAAREAEAARQRGQGGQGGNGGGANQGAQTQGAADTGDPTTGMQPATAASAAGADPRWQQMYQRIRNRIAPQQ